MRDRSWIFASLLLVAAMLLAHGAWVRHQLRSVVIADAGEDGIAALREAVFTHELARTVDEIIAEAEARTDQERCIAIARWLTGHVRNVSAFHPPGHGGDDLGRFMYRMGTCEHRSNMMVRMLDLLGIHARLWMMYNFGGRPGGGHTVVQARYDGDWHYFDPFYGVCFVRDGEVLSWDEIHRAALETPERIDDWRVSWPRERDRSRAGVPEDPGKWRRLPADQPARTYAAARIAATRSAAFFRGEEQNTLYPRVDAAALAEAPIVLGDLDGSWSDVQREGVRQGLSERLGGIGTFHDRLRVVWEFRDAAPGATYVIGLDALDWRDATPDRLRASVDGGTLLAGGQPDRSGWTIRVRAERRDFDVTLDHDLEPLGDGMRIDRVRIERVAPPA